MVNDDTCYLNFFFMIFTFANKNGLPICQGITLERTNPLWNINNSFERWCIAELSENASCLRYPAVWQH